MKLIIDIPNEAYDILTEYQVLPENIDLEYFVIHGIPLEDIKAEIIKCCDNIADIVADTDYARKIYIYEQLTDIREVLDRQLRRINNDSTM